jgi:hypothetical protein
MNYVLKLSFKDTPDCEKCMISHSKGEKRHCMGLGNRPICPDTGCRKDCPLIKEITDNIE